MSTILRFPWGRFPSSHAELERNAWSGDVYCYAQHSNGLRTVHTIADELHLEQAKASLAARLAARADETGERLTEAAFRIHPDGPGRLIVCVDAAILDQEGTR